MTVADNRYLKIEAVGSVRMMLKSHNDQTRIKVQNVLLVPHLYSNWLSVSKLTDKFYVWCSMESVVG